jgi:hypothetical protein
MHMILKIINYNVLSFFDHFPDDDSVKMPDGQMLHYDIKVKGLQPWQW